MARKVRLSDAVARDAVADLEKVARGVDTFVWDAAVAGFGLKITPTGSQSWCFQYRNAEKRTKRVSLGSVKAVSASAARAKAQAYQTATRNGADPQEDKTAQRKAKTIADLSAEWIALQRGRVARGEMSPGSLAEYESKMRLHVLPAFGKLKPADLKAAAIKEWRNKKLVESEIVSEKRVLGAEGIKGVLRVLSAFYGYLTDQEIVAVNPARGLGQFSTRHRERYLTDEETVRLCAAIDKHRGQWPHWIAIIELALLTGMRKTEILALMWDDVEEAEGRIILKKHKTQRATGVKYVPLSEQALEVLQTAKAWRREGNPFVFPSVADQSFYAKRDETAAERVMGHATAGGLQRAWGIIRKEANLDGHEGEKFVFHGIRHSVASMAISNGVNLSVVGNMLGQKSTSTTSRYAKIATSAAAGAAQVVGTIVSAQAARSRKAG